MEYTGTCITCGAEKALRWPKPLTQAECNLLATDKCRHRRPGIFVERYGVCTYCGQVNMGETHDPESEMPHMWHVLTNAAFLVALT